jgi:EAL domain-containing protein (putative c-di-GMP-specific phosphodiesterase class I)
VLETASRQMRQWEREGLAEGLDLAVSVSVRQLREPGFAESVTETLERTGLAPGRLVLEELLRSKVAAPIPDPA